MQAVIGPALVRVGRVIGPQIFKFTVKSGNGVIEAITDVLREEAITTLGKISRFNWIRKKLQEITFTDINDAFLAPYFAKMNTPEVQETPDGGIIVTVDRVWLRDP